MDKQMIFNESLSRDSLNQEDTVYFDQDPTTNDDSDFTVVSTLVIIINLILITFNQD